MRKRRRVTLLSSFQWTPRTHSHSNSCRDIAFTAYFKWNICALKIISVYASLIYFLHPGHATLIVVMTLGCFNDPRIQWVVFPLAGLTTQAGRKVSKVTNKQTNKTLWGKHNYWCYSNLHHGTKPNAVQKQKLAKHFNWFEAELAIYKTWRSWLPDHQTQIYPDLNPGPVWRTKTSMQGIFPSRVSARSDWLRQAW